jgi:hypothetical protein
MAPQSPFDCASARSSLPNSRTLSKCEGIMSFPVWVDVVRRADHAMYQVKRSGKDNVTLAEEAGYVP